MAAGDTIAIEMRDAGGRDVCGRIEQRVQRGQRGQRGMIAS